MSMLSFLGGIAGGFQATQDGIDAAQTRKDRADDREWVRSQRERVRSEQAREDELRTAVSSIPVTENIDITNPEIKQITVDDDGNPTAAQLPAMKAVPRAADKVMRDQAAANLSVGKIDKWRELTTQADGIAFKRSADRFNQVYAGAAAAPIESVAKQIKEIFDADPTNGGIKSITPVNGGLRITVADKNTGAESTREFTGATAKRDLLDAFQAYYTPETWQKLKAAEAEAAIKAREERAKERAKGVVVPAGGAFVPGEGDTRQPVRNDNGLVWTGQFNPDGSPQMVRPGRDGAGAGSGHGGKPPKELTDQATELLKDALGKADGSPEGAQRYTAALSHLDAIYKSNPQMPPRTAAAIAADIAADPSARQFAIDSDGRVVSFYANNKYAGGAQIRLASGEITPEQLAASLKPGEMSKLVENHIAQLYGQDKLAEIQRIASSPTERKAAIRQAADAGADVAALERRLELVSKYAPPRPAPKPAAATGGAAPRLYTPGGMIAPPGDTPGGPSFASTPTARYAAEKAAAARAAAAREEAARRRAAAQ